jgi:tetratricopeptide (TPR) repeat protein
MSDDAAARFRRLRGYLEADPANPALLRDVAQAALAVGELDQAAHLAQRLNAAAPHGVEGPYLLGLTAMHRGDFAAAADLFEPLMARDPQPNLRFNLAWTRAMLGEKAAAVTLLDDATVETIPAAAMLRVQIAHEAGEFERALADGKTALERFPDDPGLLGAMATLALDVEDEALARACVARGGSHPEALAAAGVIELQDGDPDAATARFDRSLAIRDHNPRAWIGRGLASLARHDAVAASRDIDEGARQFGDHIGSWITAGWAHYLAGDIAAAGQRFERALAIDPGFAESHGSLAVIDLAKGDRQAAQRRIRLALGLDRECFSAALAQSLLVADDPARAGAIVAGAMDTPLNNKGLTLAGYLAGLSRPTIH